MARKPTKEQATGRALRLAWHLKREADHAARAARHAYEKATAAHLVEVAKNQTRDVRAATRRQLGRVTRELVSR